jgi:hypothetical protein
VASLEIFSNYARTGILDPRTNREILTVWGDTCVYWLSGRGINLIIGGPDGILIIEMYLQVNSRD